MFNFAESYRRAADALGTVRLRTAHRDVPRRFLYTHAIELYVKEQLRLSGVPVRALERLGHSWARLRASFIDAGGSLDDEDEDVLSLLASTNASIDFRYIRTGAFTWPTMEALARTARSLHYSVRENLRTAGKPIR